MDELPGAVEVGPWAKEKLRALERYLDYYTTVLKNQRWRTIYVDAFAGGGRSKVRSQPRSEEGEFDLFGAEDVVPEQREFIDGSPRRALDIANPFYSYIFVDADPKRVATLNELKAEYGASRRIHVREGSAAEQIDWILSNKPTRQEHRGVAFLDPFGAHLEWRTIQALADTHLFEVFINFPLHMALNRLMTLNPAIPPVWKAQLDAFFPPGWYEQIYERDEGLFADDVMRKRKDATQRALAFYTESLRKCFGYVASPRLIKNTRNMPLYYLLWAGPHKKGLEGAEHIMRMGEELLD